MSNETVIIRTAGPGRSFYDAERRLFDHYRLSTTSRFIEIKRPRMRVRVLEAGEGRPVLLVHGGGGFVSLWASLLAQMPCWRCIAVDRPGHGLTDVFDYTSVDQRRHAVDFLTSVIESLELPQIPVIANSMGGLWALWLALDRSDLVSGLALLGSNAFLLGTSAPFPLRLLAVPGLGRLMMAAEKPSRDQARLTFRRMGHAGAIDRLPAELFDCFAAGESMPGYARAYSSLLNGALRLRGARPAVRLDEEELRKVRQPVLLIHGDRDPFGKPDDARRCAAAMRSARLVELQGGHLPWLDDPSTCAAEVTSFLQPLEPAAPILATP